MAQNYCDGCAYWVKVGTGDLRYCSYIMRNNKRRPCPPGDGCTEKVGMKVYRRRKKDEQS